MSHALGKIYSIEKKLLAYFEYDGTVDICIPTLRFSIEHIEDNWRNQGWNICKCNKQNEMDVIIHTSYGGGFYWLGKACLNCMAITEGLEPIYENDGDVIEEIGEKL